MTAVISVETLSQVGSIEKYR